MRLLDYQDISARLGVKVGTLRQWVRRGKFPPPDYKQGQNSALWKETTVKRWEKR
jgi:predicted site-specific integrase-resolvase